MDMLGFDYFRLLDLLTIARSRKHIEKYYGTAETGTFPKRLRPINVKADVDSAGLFPPIVDIDTDIRRLNLSAYAPLRYVLPAKQAEYDAEYSVAIRGGECIFGQVDREECLIHLMRVNLPKRMESSVHAIALTVERQLADVNSLLAKLDDHGDAIEELSIEDVEVDNPAFESLLVGCKVKVLLQDVDRTGEENLIERDAALAGIEPGYPLAPHYVAHVGADGAVLLPHNQAKQLLDRLKGLCLGRDRPHAQACARFDKLTKAGRHPCQERRIRGHGRLRGGRLPADRMNKAGLKLVISCLSTCNTESPP